MTNLAIFFCSVTYEQTTHHLDWEGAKGTTTKIVDEGLHIIAGDKDEHLVRAHLSHNLPKLRINDIKKIDVDYYIGGATK